MNKDLTYGKLDLQYSKLFKWNPVELSKPRRYGIALICVLISTVIRQWADANMLHTPYITYYAAVCFAAGLGGLGPGIFATLSGGILGYYLFLHGRDFILGVEIMRGGLYLGSCLAISWFAGRMLEEKRRSQKHEWELKQLFNSMNDGFVLLQLSFNNQGNVTGAEAIYTNPAYQRLSKIVGNSGGDISSSGLNLKTSAWLKKFEQVVEGEDSIIFREFSTDSDRWLLFHLYTPEKGQVALVVSDVTE